jgi:2-polyprenyl-6-methoxyphenol hydroxylase-like FAD-dependent oxidoreductase
MIAQARPDNGSRGERPLHVVIVGGGIGGLCLAQGLKKAGVSFALYERDLTATSREQGYRVHIDPTGSHSLNACLPAPLWQMFVGTAGDPGAGFGFLTEKLASLVIVEDAIVAGAAADPVHGHHAASRLTLRQILLAGLGEAVHFGKEFVRYEPAVEGRIAAIFADGTRAEGDLLVGADGANSHLRRQYLPGAERIDTGAVGIGGRLDLTDRTSGWLPPRMAAGMNVVMGPRDFLFTAVFRRRRKPADAVAMLGDALRSSGLDAGSLFGGLTEVDYLLWAFITHRDVIAADAASQDIKKSVSGRISGWHSDLRRIVAETDPQTIGAFGFLTSVRPKPWASSNVTLLGDAIHNMTPAGGVGANTALRDAALLTDMLAAVDRGDRDLVPAVHEYEQRMLDYGFAAVEKSLERTRQALAGRLARARDRTFLRLCGMLPPLRRAVFRDEWSGSEVG